MTTLAPWAAAVLLAIGSMDAAQAQAETNEMWLRGNALVTRNRLDREIRHARDDGLIRRWSPDAIEIPLRPRPPVPAHELAVPLQAEPGIPHPWARSAP